MQRLGISLPAGDLALTEQVQLIKEAEDLGYTDAWSSEVNATDGLSLLAAAASVTERIRMGTAILPVYTRGPGLLAMSIASMAELAPGRFLAGVGSSSNIIIENWNATPFEKPYGRVRDTVDFLKAALTGEKVTEDYDTFSVKGFRLGLVPEQTPPIVVAALREGMLRLAGRSGDGVILNWLSPEDTRHVTGIVREENPDPHVVARLFVLPSTDRDYVREAAARTIAAYLNVPVYAKFHEWLGRGEQLADMWRLWDEGDRKGAVAAVPDEVIDELFIHGSVGDCREQVQAYVDAGIDTPVLAITDVDGSGPRHWLNAFAPS